MPSWPGLPPSTRAAATDPVGAPSYTPATNFGRTVHIHCWGRSHHERVPASLAPPWSDRGDRGGIDRRGHGARSRTRPDAVHSGRHARPVAERVSRATSAGRVDLCGLRHRPERRAGAHDELRAVEAVVRRGPMVGCAVRSDDQPPRDLPARCRDPGLGGYRRADRRPAVRRCRCAVDRHVPLHGGRRVATVAQPRDPREALHLRPGGRPLRARPRLPRLDPGDRRKPSGHRCRLHGCPVDHLRSRRSRLGDPLARDRRGLEQPGRAARRCRLGRPHRYRVCRRIRPGPDRRHVDEPALRRVLQRARRWRAGRRVVASGGRHARSGARGFTPHDDAAARRRWDQRGSSRDHDARTDARPGRPPGLARPGRDMGHHARRVGA